MEFAWREKGGKIVDKVSNYQILILILYIWQNIVKDQEESTKN